MIHPSIDRTATAPVAVRVSVVREGLVVVVVVVGGGGLEEGGGEESMSIFVVGVAIVRVEVMEVEIVIVDEMRSG